MATRSSSRSTSRSARLRLDSQSVFTTPTGCWVAASSRAPAARGRSCRYWLPDLVEALVAERVALPVLVIEVPPLERVRDESLVLHDRAQQPPVPPLLRRAARIVRPRARSGLVVRA